MQQTWYVDFAGDIFFDENFRPRSVKTFIIQRSIRNFHTFLRISSVYLYTSTYSKGDSPVVRHSVTLSDIWHGTQTFFLAKACKKTSPSSLYFKMILHPVSYGIFVAGYGGPQWISFLTWFSLERREQAANTSMHSELKIAQLFVLLVMPKLVIKFIERKTIFFNPQDQIRNSPL